jgi:acetyltransferase
MLGVVRLHADNVHETGEYAILLRSDLKGQGLGWELMRLMIEWAKADGLSVIEGQVLAENTTMLDMCRALGFEIRTDPGDSEMKIVRLPIASLRSERRATA